MVKKIVISMVCLTLFVFGEESVNVYSHRHYDSDKILFKAFEKETGIKVNLLTAKAEELVTKLSLEGKQTSADVLITADIANLYQAKELGLLQPIDSKILKANIPANLRDKEQEWFGLTKRARVLVYNKKTIDPKKIATYLDLANSKLGETILTRTSSNSYNQSLMAFMIAHEGEEKALAWAKGVVKNMARHPKGNDRDQIYAVASGDGDIAIANTYYFAGMLQSNNPKDRDVAQNLGVVFPNQNSYGTHINISGAGVTKYGKNKVNGQKLIEFLSSKEAQYVFANSNFEYPVNKEVKLAGVIANWDRFNEDQLEIELLGKYNKKAVELLTKAQWK